MSNKESSGIDVPESFYTLLWRLIDQKSEWLADHVPGKYPSPLERATYDCVVHVREGMLVVLAELTGLRLVKISHHATARVLNKRRIERAA